MVSSSLSSSTLRPVSSLTSRRAVSAMLSPGSWVPFGRVHCSAPRAERRATSTTSAPAAGSLSTTPPAEMARAVRMVSSLSLPGDHRAAHHRAGDLDQVDPSDFEDHPGLAGGGVDDVL